MHAILGTSEHCIATHPSDMCVALAALDARVLATGNGGERSIAFADFHRLPGDTPQIDSNLRADEIITAIELPPKGFAGNYTYLKIRDRLSYAFALVSVAVGLEIEGGTIKEARLALGGVAHKPWRDREAEAQLDGAPATRESFLRAADTVLRRARGFGHNDFKIELARRGIVRALAQAARGTPQSQADKRISSKTARMRHDRRPSYLGKPTSRIDGRAKVTGAAKYAAEYNVPGLAHGVVVSSAIAKGRIKRIHTADALAVDGVLDVFTHEHRPKLASSDENYEDEVAPPGSPFRPLYDDQIRIQRPAGGAGRRGGVRDRAICGFARPRRVRAGDACHRLRSATRARHGREAGDAGAVHYARQCRARRSTQAPVRVKAEYRMPVEHHNPMEPFAATAVWEGDDRITVFDKTQGPQNCRNYVANVFGMPRDKVRVLSPYVGGAIRVRLASAIRVAARRAGGARAQALGAGDAHPPADVHARLSRREHPGAGARSRQRRQARLVPARRRSP